MAESASNDFVYLCRAADASKRSVSSVQLKWKIDLIRNIIYIIMYVAIATGNIIYYISRKASSLRLLSLQYLDRTAPAVSRDIDIEVSENAPSLLSWFDRGHFSMIPSEKSVLPIPEEELYRFISFASLFDAHLQVSATLCNPIFSQNVDMSFARKEISALLDIIQSSQRLKPLCRRLIAFLKHFLSSSDSEILDFLRKLVTVAKHTPFAYAAKECHSSTFLSENDKFRAEAVLAVCGLFMKQNIHVFTFYLNFTFMKRDRTQSGVLHVLVFFMLSYCGFDDEDVKAYNASIDESQLPIHTIRNAVFASNKKFKPLFSELGGRDVQSYKQALRWDFAVNFCDSFTDSNWPVDLMERAAWALSIGREFLSQDLLQILEKSKLTPNINFTFYDVKALLSLSVSGLIKFTGYDGCMFNLTANDEPLFLVHGYMRKPKLKHLVELKLLREISRGVFQVIGFPGISSNHKGVKIGDRILFVRSKENSPFRADVNQTVG